MNLEEKSIELLQQELDQLQLDENKIKVQIEYAKQIANSQGIYSDAGWYSRAMYSLREKQRQIQKHLQEIAGRKKAFRRMINNSFERKFLQVCKKRLDKELYFDILRQVEDELNAIEAEASE